MNEKLMLLKEKLYLKKPIIIFSILSILFGLFLYFTIHFNIPDYYIDRNAAFQAAQLPDVNLRYIEMSKLKSLSHKVYNTIFQIFGWLLTITIVSIFFRIYNFKDFRNLLNIKNKVFIFSWINLSYIIYAISLVPAYMADLRKHEYNSYSDSFSIPFFSIIITLVLFSVIYYPILNLLFYIVYKLESKRKIYMFILGFIGVLIILNILMVFLSLFTKWHIILNTINLINLSLILSASNFIVKGIK